MINSNSTSKDTFLSFIIGNEHFAVNVGKVLEVLQSQNITNVPNAATYMRGVINFRGEVVPVVETRIKFGLPARDNFEKYVIIVLEVEVEGSTIILGAIADKVQDVIDIPENQIKPVPKMSGSLNLNFFDGIYRRDDKFIMLLNVDKIFSQDSIDIQAITEDMKNVIV